MDKVKKWGVVLAFFISGYLSAVLVSNVRTYIDYDSGLMETRISVFPFSYSIPHQYDAFGLKRDHGAGPHSWGLVDETFPFFPLSMGTSACTVGGSFFNVCVRAANILFVKRIQDGDGSIQFFGTVLRIANSDGIFKASEFVTDFEMNVAQGDRPTVGAEPPAPKP